MRKPRPFTGRSLTTSGFWDSFSSLSRTVQRQAREAHTAWLQDLSSPGLRFKKIHSDREVYSVRINRNVRALGLFDGPDFVWFWIGKHEDYEKLIKSL